MTLTGWLQIILYFVLILADYEIQARFSLAAIYDRASETPAGTP